jgi:hypothetical protein
MGFFSRLRDIFSKGKKYVNKAERTRADVRIIKREWPKVSTILLTHPETEEFRSAIEDLREIW